MSKDGTLNCGVPLHSHRKLTGLESPPFSESHVLRWCRLRCVISWCFLCIMHRSPKRWVYFESSNFSLPPWNTLVIFIRKDSVQMVLGPVDANLHGLPSASVSCSSYSLHLLWALQNASHPCLLSVLVTATSGNGDFGDWSAFNQAPSGPVASGGELFGSAPQSAVELISASQPALGPPPAASNSADLFDLMGSSQATMTSSQSMNFSPMSTNTVGLGLPMSRSQVSCLFPLGIGAYTSTRRSNSMMS